MKKGCGKYLWFDERHGFSFYCGDEDVDGELGIDGEIYRHLCKECQLKEESENVQEDNNV